MKTTDAIQILSELPGRSVASVASRNEHVRVDTAALFYLARLERVSWTLEQWTAKLAELDGSSESVAEFATRYRSIA